MSGFLKGCAVGLGVTGLVGVVGLMVAGPPAPGMDHASAGQPWAPAGAAQPGAQDLPAEGAETPEGEPEGTLVISSDQSAAPVDPLVEAPTLAEAGDGALAQPDLTEEEAAPAEPVMLGLAEPETGAAADDSPVDPVPGTLETTEVSPAPDALEEPGPEGDQSTVLTEVEPAPEDGPLALEADPGPSDLEPAPEDSLAAAPAVSTEGPQIDGPGDVTRGAGGPALADGILGEMARPGAASLPASEEGPVIVAGPSETIELLAEDPAFSSVAPAEEAARPVREAARAVAQALPQGAEQPSDDSLPVLSSNSQPAVVVNLEIVPLVAPEGVGGPGWLTLEEPVLRTPQSYRPALSLPDEAVFPAFVWETAAPPADGSLELVIVDETAPADTVEVVEIVPEGDVAGAEAVTETEPAGAETVAEAETVEPEVAEAVAEAETVEPEVAEAETVEPEVAEPVAEAGAETAEEPTILTVGEGASILQTQTEANSDGPVIRTTPSGESSGFGELAPDVRILRPGSEPGEDAVAEAEPAAEVDPSAPPLERFAVAFDGGGDRPLLAVILIDDETSSIAPGDVSALGLPVAVAIDPLGDAALERMALYRDAGTEVMMLANFPTGAQPGDIEVFFAGFRDALPEAVAVLDTGDVAASRDLMAQLSGAVNEAGLGLVIPGTGINSGVRNAEQAGLPVARIHRDLDGEGQDAAAMRRLMDQAAFRASQSEGLVLVARLRPETLEAITAWQDTTRAASVAFAPISRVLLGER